MEPKEIKIKYTRDIEKIHEIEVGDWVDLRVALDTYMTEGELYHIPLGVAMQLPEGYEALVIPRSSTFKKYGIVQANSVGLIDETYCGDSDEWHFPAYATRETFIPKKYKNLSIQNTKTSATYYAKRSRTFRKRKPRWFWKYR